MRSVIDILDLTVEEIESLVKTANDIIENPEKYAHICDGKKLSTLSIAYNVELKNRNCRNLLLSIIKDIYEEEKRNNKATA